MSDYRHLLGELLAVIHRDGGQYIYENGWKKATEDAMLICSWYNLNSDETQKD